MKNIEIQRLTDLNEEYKEKAVQVFVDGFGYIFSFTKDRDILIKLFMNSFDFSLAYVAVCENNIVGFMGIANNKVRTLHFNVLKCKELFGNIKGTIIQKQLSAIMEKPAVYGDNDLHIDYLTTDKNYRGQGIATKLIDFVCDELEYEECYIEVLSKNINAKRLYEYIGFTEYKREYNPFTIMQGLGYPIKLKKRIK